MLCCLVVVSVSLRPAPFLGAGLKLSPGPTLSPGLRPTKLSPYTEPLLNFPDVFQEMGRKVQRMGVRLMPTSFVPSAKNGEYFLTPKDGSSLLFAVHCTLNLRALTADWEAPNQSLTDNYKTKLRKKVENAVPLVLLLKAPKIDNALKRHMFFVDQASICGCFTCGCCAVLMD